MLIYRQNQSVHCGHWTHRWLY